MNDGYGIVTVYVLATAVSAMIEARDKYLKTRVKSDLEYATIKENDVKRLLRQVVVMASRTNEKIADWNNDPD